eukprot:TRINITY_DN1285_c0_g1_i1.p2 TRINITY_DN1285_c0_g1~~TRINITY_DN1285_c0_g1_i1.p2  ORF type:complete len:255 (-),score=74.16 TRINITY_DN1285_c0_g1_i1:80-808(-)
MKTSRPFALFVLSVVLLSLIIVTLAVEAPVEPKEVKRKLKPKKETRLGDPVRTQIREEALSKAKKEHEEHKRRSQIPVDHRQWMVEGERWFGLQTAKEGVKLLPGGKIGKVVDVEGTTHFAGSRAVVYSLQARSFDGDLYFFEEEITTTFNSANVDFLKLGLQSMKIGETATFYVHWSAGYGTAGTRGGLIPPYTSLEVEMTVHRMKFDLSKSREERRARFEAMKAGTDSQNEEVINGRDDL